MKVNKNSPRRPLRPLSAIIDFPTPAGRRWGKHFRDGKKSSECWERENNPKKLCVFVSVWSVAIATLETVPLQRALDDDDDARRRARFRWVGANSHKEKHTSILWVLTRTSLGQSCRMVEGGSFSTVRHGKRPAATDMGSWQSRAPVVLFIIDTTTEERERGLGNKVRESLWQRPSCTADQIECSPLHSYLYDVTKN